MNLMLINVSTRKLRRLPAFPRALRLGIAPVDVELAKEALPALSH